MSARLKTTTYENVIIGNFLVGFGAALGRISHLPLASLMVNLLQQTADLDKRLCDIVISSPGFVRLLEFKRKENKSNKEQAKHTFIRRSLGSPTFDHLQALARRIHWYIETTDDDNPHLNVKIVPYIDFVDKQMTRTTLIDFINGTAAAFQRETTGEHSTTDYSEYFRMLQTRDDQPLRKEKRCGGLILKFGPNGSMSFAWLPDFYNFYMTPRQISDSSGLSYSTNYAQSLAEQIEISLKIEQNISQALEKEASQERVRAPSYGIRV